MRLGVKPISQSSLNLDKTFKGRVGGGGKVGTIHVILI